jgi:hypothetical protein
MAAEAMEAVEAKAREEEVGEPVVAATGRAEEAPDWARAAAGVAKDDAVAETEMAAEAMEAVEAKAREEERELAAAETGKEAAATAAVERVMEEEGKVAVAVEAGEAGRAMEATEGVAEEV